MNNTAYINNLNKIINEETERLIFQTESDKQHIKSNLKFITGLDKAKKILDVGCGTGALAFSIKDYTSENCHIYGVDFVKKRLSIANELKKSKGISNIEFCYGSAFRLPFEDNTFDIVTSRYLFQHLTDLGKAIREMNRVLRPNGRIIIIDINEIKNTYDEKYPNLFLRNKGIIDIYRQKGIKFYSVNDIKKSFINEGLNNISVYQFNRESAYKHNGIDDMQEKNIRHLLVDIMGVMSDKQYDDALLEMEAYVKGDDADKKGQVEYMYCISK